LAAGLQGKAVHHAKAKPGALTNRLGGEERIESPGDDFRRHTSARIGHAHGHIAPGRQLQQPCRLGFECFVGGFDRQAAAIGHCIACIDTKI
jgi:hypothetical protein